MAVNKMFSILSRRNPMEVEWKEGGAGGGASGEGEEVVALHEFRGESNRELSFNKGDLLIVINKFHPDWWEASLNGQVGVIPANFVSPTHPAGGLLQLRGAGCLASTSHCQVLQIQNDFCFRMQPRRVGWLHHASKQTPQTIPSHKMHCATSPAAKSYHNSAKHETSNATFWLFATCAGCLGATHHLQSSSVLISWTKFFAGLPHCRSPAAF